MSDDSDERRRPSVETVLEELRSTLDTASRVDQVAEGQAALRDDVALLGERIDELKAQQGERIDAIERGVRELPERVAERIEKAGRRARPDDTPTPRPRVSQRFRARVAGETSSADVPALPAPATSPPPAHPPAPPADDPARTIAQFFGSGARIWNWLPGTARAFILLGVGGVFGLGSCEALRRWAAYEQRQREGAPPPADMSTSRDLLAERPRPAPPPPPPPPREEKPKRPNPKPKPDPRRDAEVVPKPVPREHTTYRECDGGPHEPEYCNDFVPRR